MRTYYQTKTPDSLKTVSWLENDLFPIVQRTFDVCMKAYETLNSKEELPPTGPLKHDGKNFSIEADRYTKYLYYKKTLGKTIFFTVYPHEDSAIGDTHRKTYAPYQQTGPECVKDTFLFQVDGSGIPILEESPGLILFNKTEELGGLVITAYRGNTTILPYTESLSIALATGKTPANEKLHNIIEIVQRKQKDPQAEIPQAVLQNVTETLPEILRGNTIYGASMKPEYSFNTQCINEKVKTLLGNQESTFIPFPRTPLEEAEQTYLYLLELCEQTTTASKLPKENKFLQYIKEKAFPEATIEQIVHSYEVEILSAYTKEAEEEIRLQQEHRTRMVAEGAHYQPSDRHSKKNFHRGKKGRKVSLQRETSSSSSSSSSSSNSSSNQEFSKDILEAASEKARKKLEALKATSRGPTKFRKFMQLVNLAQQGLHALGQQTSAALNKSSHGKVEMEGSSSQSIVRPHGGAKEKSISSLGQKRLLTGLVEGLLQRIQGEHPSQK